MKRIVALVCLVGAGAFAASVALADRGGGDHGDHGRTIRVVEHATTDAVTNEGNGSGDAVGDVLTFNNDVYDQNNSTRVGSDQGYCVRLVVGQSWECVWTTLLDRGQLTVEGPFYDTSDSKLAITGGTGAFSRARGWMKLHARAGGTEYDFIFHLKS
jgi:allene oxide cyclase